MTVMNDSNSMAPAFAGGWINAADHGASGSEFQTAGAVRAGSTRIAVQDAGNYKVGLEVSLSRRRRHHYGTVANTAASLLPALAAALLGLVSCQTNRLSSGTTLHLAKDGATWYVIVKPEKPTEVDDYAVNILTNFLFQKTGAIFPSVVPGQVASTSRHIFVGLSAPAQKTLGKDPLASLKDQEYVARSVGNDIFLYGKGLHGNLYAVLDFMENTLGRRWYSRYDKPVFEVTPTSSVKPFDSQSGFSFAYRHLMCFPSEFEYQQGMNMGFSEYDYGAQLGTRKGKDRFPPGVVSLKFIPAFVHTAFPFVPPAPDALYNNYPDIAKVITNKNYFKTNPEFFSMNYEGKRVVNMQLCFSNSKLRQELTGNILAYIESLKRKDIIIALDANDCPGAFCYCPDCAALEKKYESAGGPMYDYLLELCTRLEKECPDAMVKTLAYRRSQTQKPPKLANARRFPDNMIVVFGNVEDSLGVDWNHPGKHSTYDDLLKWGELTPNLWTWYYPNPYAVGYIVPFANVNRAMNDLRMMKKAGVKGVGYEFTTKNVWTGDGFVGLQMYLFCKLARNINGDIPALIKEYTGYQYGRAAALTRKYLEELEAESETSKDPMPLIAREIDFHGVFAYLGDANIRRWQSYFDEMEQATASDSRCLENVRRLRRALEFATLGKWNDLSKAYPGYFKDYREHKKRLGKIHPWEAALLADFETVIQAGGKVKPLPEPFQNLEPSQVRRFVPSNTRVGEQCKLVTDAEAAFGYASTVDLPDLPFNFGFAGAGIDGPHRKLEANEIKPGAYQLYKLGEIAITPDCRIRLGYKSWMTNLELGERLYAPGEDNKYTVYVSLKFAGASYGGKEEKDLVLCDQIIFVKTNAR